ncbi:peptidase C14 caspase catalytic subunit p20 [Rippkaea orientalis PCC 8801]|uniref:Peptidase C14 caspase catalytic subunit p20 n=1 Tax=Rippkaea orientalis (strain PCC 8801 / RF-1) TaxID=41431 RepID=B7JVS7_RIPO1|nr:caspase family protein [Rippkaea orientalis]ACK64648.1 peptidase C14 caspase catalytic subunit p20 [Rippkaea orientalis PCC 8801]
MKWDRRTFLKTLLTWGVSQIGLEGFRGQPKIQQYYQTLAAPTPRKLALLVGINDYGTPFNLKGCLTDVERQKELLIYRFGFSPQDILTLTGQEATREAIETAFQEHLTQQAQGGDVVVFHFSGYGNLVKSSSGELLRGLIPSDGIISTKGQIVTHNLLEDALILWGRSLATEKLTFVLDTSYHYLGQELQGNLKVRSFPSSSQEVDPQELARQITGTAPKGIILGASGQEQVATEIASSGFSSGLFTYALTQYLWEVTSPSNVTVTLGKTTETLLPIIGTQQQPQPRDGDKQPLFTYYLLPTPSHGAEGLITSLDDSTNATIKLTGLPLPLLQHYGLNSCFTVTTSPPSSPILVQLRSREGLKGKVHLISALDPNSDVSALAVGQFLQESIRFLPKTIGLTVALEKNLERIERVDATSTFSAIAQIHSVITAGEPGADCILAKETLTEETDLSPSSGGYGLLLPGGVQVPNTFGQSGEAIKSAVERLRPDLQRLLAAKLWRLTLNEESSQLPIRVSLESLDQDSPVIDQRQTTRRVGEGEKAQETPLADLTKPSHGLLQVPRGSRLQFRWQNLGDRPIYYLLLGIDARARTLAYLPPEAALIAPGETLVVPSPTLGLNWTVASTPGWEQILAISCSSPFKKTFETLRQSTPSKPDQGQILLLNTPLTVAQALLQDLHGASAVKSELLGTATDSYALDVKIWATLSFVYQVV